MLKSLLVCALGMGLCAAPASAQKSGGKRKPRVTQIPSLRIDPALSPRYIPRSAIGAGQTVWCDDDPRPAGTEYGFDVVGKTDPQGCRGQAMVIEIPTGSKREEYRRRSEQAARDWRAFEAEENRKNEDAIAAGRVRLGMNGVQARRAWGNPTAIRRAKDEDGNDIETWLYQNRGRLRFFNDYLDRIVEF
jgi:hypothetical protein